jgi:hypothetical protein
MKIITPIILAGAMLAFCGCSTDQPVFANEATQASEAQRSANTSDSTSNSEQQRDVYNQMNSGAAMQGGAVGGPSGSGAISRDASAGAGMSH